MKKLLLICSIFLLGNSFINAQLSIGDIAFVGFNEDSGPSPSQDHSFSFITLANIPGNEVIYFTEEGWNDDVVNWVGNTEVHLTWTAPGGGISCGTVIYITESAPDVFTIIGGGSVTIGAGSSWNFSGGDQVLAYQSATPRPATPPTFLAGITTDDGGAGPGINPITLWNDNAPYGGASSGLPFGLTNGVNCISMFPAIFTEQDNSKYTGTLTGTSTALRALINNRSNWTSHNSIPFDITPAGYSPSVTCVVPCTDPTIPSVTASPSTVCQGSNSTLTITGTLNDATQWAIYTGSCGGSLLGTTASSTFVVTPSGPSTTYFIRGEGGCVTPGSCGTVSVTVNAIPGTPTISAGGPTTFCAGGNVTLTSSSASGNQWSLNGTPIGGAINQNYIASVAGNYTVIVTTSGCPSLASAATTVTVNTVDVSTTTNIATITSNATPATYQWLDCNNSFAFLVGETNQQYTATGSGDFAVQVTQNGCVDTSACVNILITDVNGNTFSSEINIYPNPTNGSITIDIDQINSNANLKVYGVVGREVINLKLTSSKTQIDLSNRDKGVYFIKIQNGDEIITKRVVKH